jgi:precorrin-6B methylase 2
MGLMNLVVHGDMLLDDHRNAALASAVREIVRPGDVVADVGAGTGLLSMVAARAGAARVYAIERGPIATVARAVVRRNGLADIVDVVNGDAREFTPERPVDVVVCETLGIAALDEGFRDVLTVARDRMLRPGGRLLPAALDILVAPVCQDAVAAIDRRHELDAVLGFDLSPFADLTRRVHRRVRLGPSALLAAPRRAFRLESETMCADDPLAADLRFEIATAGVLGGFLLWFDAELSPSVRLSNLGDSPTNHWGQAFLTVEPQRVESRSQLELAVSIDDRPGTFRIGWQLHEAVGSGARSW